MSGQSTLFRFIFQIEIFLVWLLFSLVFGALGHLSTGYLLYLAMPLWLLSGALFFKYGFVIIEYSARGHGRMPRMGAHIVDPDPRVYRQALVLLISLGLIVLTPGPWRWITTGLVLLVTPAITAFITFHWHLVQALRPDHIWHFMRGMGITYYPLRFLVTASLMLVLFMIEDATQLSALFPGGRFALAAIATYLLLVTFRTTGLLLHSRREAIGIITDFSAEQTAAIASVEAHGERKQFVSDLALLSRRGQADEAFEQLERRLKRHRYEQDSDYYQLLRELKDPTLLWRMAEGYIGRLMDHSVTAAWEIFEALWSESGGKIRLASGTRSIALGRSASTRSQKQAAMNMLGRFESDYPKHPRTREALLMGADLACELGELATARELLSAVDRLTGPLDAGVYQRCQQMLAD